MGWGDQKQTLWNRETTRFKIMLKLQANRLNHEATDILQLFEVGHAMTCLRIEATEQVEKPVAEYLDEPSDLPRDFIHELLMLDASICLGETVLSRQNIACSRSEDAAKAQAVLDKS